MDRVGVGVRVDRRLARARERKREGDIRRDQTCLGSGFFFFFLLQSICMHCLGILTLYPVSVYSTVSILSPVVVLCKRVHSGHSLDTLWTDWYRRRSIHFSGANSQATSRVESNRVLRVEGTGPGLTLFYSGGSLDIPARVRSSGPCTGIFMTCLVWARVR